VFCAIATLVWNIHVFMRMPMRAILGIRAKWRFYAAVAALLIVTGPAWADPTEVSSLDPTGEWLVTKGWARIRIIDCNGRLWGVVSWEIYPDVDSHNPDSSKRSRPTLGMPILLEMAQTRTNQWDGQIYNAEDGNTYSANISLVSSNILRVQGCFLGILCGGENWTRVNPPKTNHAPPSPNSAEAPTSNLLETDKHVCLRLVGPSALPPESGRGYR
jgi:uncharacterized protein (DUF2147 family)